MGNDVSDADSGTSSHEECKQNNGGRNRGFELGKDPFSFVRELRDLILLINFNRSLACDERFMLRGSSLLKLNKSSTIRTYMMCNSERFMVLVMDSKS